MTDKEVILKILNKSGIEFEESEDNELKFYTESGVEFTFNKNGKLKSLGQVGELVKSVDGMDRVFGADWPEDEDY